MAIPIKSGNWQQCIDLCTSYLENNPGDHEVLCSRHYAYNAIGQYKDALADMDKAINCAPFDLPNRWSYYDFRACVYMKLNDWKNAADDFSTSITSCPRSTSWFIDKASDMEAKRKFCMEAQLKLLSTTALSSPADDGEKQDALATQIAALVQQKLQATNTQNKTAPLSGTKPQKVNSAIKNRPIKDKWALVIGISKFANSKYNLNFAAKDARDFYDFLVNEANFKRDHVLLLLDEKATRANIMSAFGDEFLPAVSEPDDLVVVYVSTHGTPAKRDKGGKSYIVAHDTDTARLYASGVDMNELYGRIRGGVKTDRALIVMDTCYSGAGVPGAKALNAADNFDAQEVASGCGHLVITSSSPNERSWESKVSNNGVFTKYLLEALRANNKKVDVKSAFNLVEKNVSWEVKSSFGEKQTPQLGGEWEGTELILSVPPIEPRPMFNADILQLMKSVEVSPTQALPNTKPLIKGR